MKTTETTSKHEYKAKNIECDIEDKSFQTFTIETYTPKTPVVNRTNKGIFSE